MKEGRDIGYSAVRGSLPTECNPEIMNAEDPLFILYTSGSTGKPKGVVHTTGGYGVWAATSFDWIFDYSSDDIFWCTADIGWITGHSYVVYGPLAMGATSVMFDGVPNYPDFGRFWETVDRLGVTIFYTAPTAIRALMREGDEPVKRHDRSTTSACLGTVWRADQSRSMGMVLASGRRLPLPGRRHLVADGNGRILISPFPGATQMKPGSATKPLPGIKPLLVDANHQLLEGPSSGNLCLSSSWPGQMRTVWNDHGRFFETYFKTYPGLYFTGDGCRRDEDGDYWITGRVDDVINVSGHRIGTAEVESSLVSHPKVAEAAVVGSPHDIKGQAIYAFVTLNVGEEGSDQLRKDLVQEVRHDIGALAAPEKIHFTPALPKTRSGKIMRRILGNIAEGANDGFGDTSTLPIRPSSTRWSKDGNEDCRGGAFAGRFLRSELRTLQSST